MRVKLLKHVIENGGIKVSRRGRRPDGTYLSEVAYTLGAVVEMSDASAQKYIAAGLAEPAQESQS